MPDGLRVLGFDTSAAHCAAAVVCGDRVLARRVEPMAKGQAERLFPLLEEMLAAAGLGWSDLDAVGVGTGPGNFTGIRISVAAARGLALSLGIPAIGVPVTEAAAHGAPRPCRAVVVLRGDEVVYQDFPADEDAATATGPALARQDDLPPGGPATCEALHPAAVAIARIAGERAAALRPDQDGRAVPAVPRPAPLYLRPADAAPPRDPRPVILP